MVSELAFTGLVGLVAIQRLAELRRSARNEARLRAAGAVEHAPGQMRFMRALHALWLVSALLEVWWLDPPAHPVVTVLALAVLMLGQWLRHAAMRALGHRWTVKILVLPGEPPVTGGVFRHVRHPNYLGVALELAALPLVHGAWLTALVFSVANAALLFCRIRAEERALEQAGPYRASMGGRRRFLPWRRAQ